VLALALYLGYGAPDQPGMPHADVMQAMARQQKASTAQIDALVEKVEARLREAPQDGKGWDVIAPVYFKIGRFRDAANAFQQAMRLLGESVTRLNGFADATVFAADGIVTEDARKAYARVVELDPKRIEARFWLALAKEQDGNLADARSDFQKLLAEAPADAPWRSAVEDRVAGISQKLDGKVAARPEKGPSQEQMDAAKDMDPVERQRMIEGMVAGLAEKLKANGNDVAGWLRLVRAYSVLNKPEAARAALADARKALAGDDKALAQLSQLAASLGLGS
jgi:cytochrome c-type biogenesis protein CcmH